MVSGTILSTVYIWKFSPVTVDLGNFSSITSSIPDNPASGRVIWVQDFALCDRDPLCNRDKPPLVWAHWICYKGNSGVARTRKPGLPRLNGLTRMALTHANIFSKWKVVTYASFQLLNEHPGTHWEKYAQTWIMLVTCFRCVVMF